MDSFVEDEGDRRPLNVELPGDSEQEIELDLHQLEAGDFVKRVNNVAFKFGHWVDEFPPPRPEAEPLIELTGREESQEPEVDHHRYREIIERMPVDLCEVKQIKNDSNSVFRAIAQGLSNGKSKARSFSSEVS